MTGRVSSPASTGGAGTLFEQHVDAFWLAQLLVQAIPPVLLDCMITEVHFQTNRLGWNTDDFLVVGENGAGSHRRLVGQVKRTFTVSSANEECKKTMQDFWKDFQKSDRFTPGSDRLALVTLRGTSTLLEHFSGLLDCARAARDSSEFEHRLTTQGFLNAKAVKYCDEIRAIIGEVEGRSIAAADVWAFLRALHVLSLDLNSATGQTEAAVKSLLAYTAAEGDTVAAAEASWNALLAVVGAGMPESRSYRRDDLPEALRQRHSPVGGTEQRVLRALADHSTIILDRIRSTIGAGLHLGRAHIVQRVIEQTHTAQVVLAVGAAGSGKSGIAKDVVAILAADHFVFSFRAEEFALPHFDETLHNGQIPANATKLAAIVSGQTRKVLLIESVERLLEASTRDAFSDMLSRVVKDKSWQLILTCRDYSADLVRSCFLGHAGVDHSVVTVPLLGDEELEEVVRAYPVLARPLADAALRPLLRNPYVLDKALRIPWSGDRVLPQSEREFRAVCWQEIVRVDSRAAGDMPRRRGAAFMQIALRRARALALYTACDGLDGEAVRALRNDSLVVSPSQNSLLVAPAHDVLEDWAILQWIDEQHAVHAGSAGELCSVLGLEPAVRRTFRKWVGELLERDTAAADNLFRGVLRDPKLPAQFRDDAIVSLLRSPASPSFLDAHTAELFANDKQLLRRVIHLLRVASVTTPAWVKLLPDRPSLFNVPEGPAWPCILRLVQTNLGSFAGADRALLVGLIEDWARGVSWQCPYPDGADSAAEIAHWLLAGFDDYRSDDQRKRVLRVIAKVPNAGRDRFVALLQGSGNERPDSATRGFREIIFETVEGMPAARDMPDSVVSVANEHLLCSEADLRSRWGYYGSDLELETLFGIKRGRSHGFFPASAYRGPFFQLLRHHPDKGLRFILGLFKHSADWYAHPRVPSEHVEPPFEIKLTFVEGTSKSQWCNGRLWNLYRGTSVGPYVLQSILMALECWLLEYAKANPDGLDAVLLFLLLESDSAAVTAVVASVATAFPRAAGATLLVLLGSPPCIRLDHVRLVQESQAPSKMFGLMSQLNVGNKLYEAERKGADELPHRSSDLETAVMNLQLGPLAGRAHEILDRYRAEMRPVDEQNEDERLWRLALHRMDLRQYAVAGDDAEGPVAADGEKSAEDAPRRARLQLNLQEDDPKKIADQSAADYQAMGSRLGLLMWGMKVFRGEEAATYSPARWREFLLAGQAPQGGVADVYDPGQGGPGYVAAVCVRDHWDEMADSEREWCVGCVCSEVERGANNWNQMARVQRYEMSADRPCAWVVPLLLGKSLAQQQQRRVAQALVLGLTHATNEVRSYAAWGVAKNLWTMDRDLALRCVHTLAAEASLLQTTHDEERSRLLQEQQFSEAHGGGWADRVAGEVALAIRQRFFEGDGIPADSLEHLDPTQWFGAEASARILAILGQAPTEPVAIAAFHRLGETLVAWWDADDDCRHDRYEWHPGRSHETEAELTGLLENFLLRTSAPAAGVILQPILDAVDRHPEECRWLVLGLIGQEDRQPSTAQFWSLWELFADKVRNAKWLQWLDAARPTGQEMLSAMFLGASWKDDIRHWRSLEGHSQRVHSLFDDLPASSVVLDHYLRFLYHVGEHSLPEAFIRIANRLQQGDPAQLLKLGNSVFLLEVLLQRYVFGRPLQLKSQNDLRDAVLVLLDALVEQGSSAAFRMRDDFVTPLPVQ
ncbi:MAG: hypothetical protein ABSG86_11960 [Thermoguttaceae bacterium]|jgi:hypothetical protein